MTILDEIRQKELEIAAWEEVLRFLQDIEKVKEFAKEQAARPEYGE